MSVFLTADLHIGHTNIIYHCRRPFKDKYEHDYTIISNYNARVDSDDHVYILGDICWHGYEQEIQKLNGHKHLILGNHDKRKVYEELRKDPANKIVRIVDVFNLKINAKTHIWLSHYPHRSWKGSSNGAYHAYGHCHGSIPNYNRSMDVGVDCNNFRPVRVEDFINKLKDEPMYDVRGR